MNHDIGFICQACGSVTIFQSDTNHPRCCARCHDPEPLPAADRREAPTLPGVLKSRLQMASLDWQE